MTIQYVGYGKMKIRKAKKEDIESLVNLDREANKEIKWWNPLKRKDFLKFLKNKNCLYVAEEDNKVVGYQSARREEKTMILEDIYVKKEFRGKKMATFLIKRIIFINKKFGITQIKFNCPERLRRFYERFGFKVSSLVMKKELK